MSCNNCEFRPELYYDQEFQIWLAKEPDGNLAVGMTDISQTIAGRILHVRVRKPGTLRPAGKPVATVESGKWAGPVPNFIECKIVEGNEQVMDKPSLLNKDPYGSWIARIESTEDVDSVLSRFLTGEAARKGYCARAQNEDIQCGRVDE
ncbi:MAG: glycine cleavage system protein H [Gammaproteobacteria bacterium]|nr:glycine cleavage system protein H [Gammaproteobacteria bacterium]MDH5693215.1 glycine cleavage system protein H [Gammaproteobacteria bacterium]